MISYMITKLILLQQRDYLRVVLSFVRYTRYVTLRYVTLRYVTLRCFVCYCQHTVELQMKIKTILRQSTCSHDSAYIRLSVD